MFVKSFMFKNQSFEYSQVPYRGISVWFSWTANKGLSRWVIALNYYVVNYFSYPDSYT